MELFSPATPDAAAALLATQSPTFDTPGQHALFRDDLVRRMLDRGSRRPDLIWAARLPDGTVAGLVGARALRNEMGLLDLLALPAEPESRRLVLAAATAWARSLSHAEASFTVPPAADPLAEPAPRAAVDAFAEHGWRVLVTRKQYELAPYEGLAEGVPDVPLEPAGPDGRERLEQFVRQMLPGSLDVRDQEGVAEHGLVLAAKKETESLLDDDPIECFWFTVVDGQDAGLVIYRTMPNGHGYVLHVGVAEEFRGRGLSRMLVATATRALVAEGATTLIASTDDANWPMARAFDAAGWRQAESRIDLTLA